MALASGASSLFEVSRLAHLSLALKALLTYASRLRAHSYQRNGGRVKSSSLREALGHTPNHP